jgi:3-oxoacyl-[acyl-carrier-protein] synthase-3
MKLLSISKHVPKSSYSTDELIRAFDGRLSPDLERTIETIGVQRRYCLVDNLTEVMTKDEKAIQSSSTTEMACEAANRCIQDAGVITTDIGLLIGITNTQSFILPGLAPSMIAHMQGLLSPSIGVFNLQGQGCSGLIKGIELAGWYLQVHPDRMVLVVAAEAHSPYCPALLEKQYYGFPEIKRARWGQEQESLASRGTLEVIQSMLFGDGAAGLLLCASSENTFGHFCHLTNEYADDARLMMMIDGGTQYPTVNGKPRYEMNKRIPQRGAEYARSLVNTILINRESPISDVRQASMFYIHTGSKRILDVVCKQLGIATDSPKVASCYSTLQNYGNLSSASIGFMLADTYHRTTGVGLMIGFGLGFSASAGIVYFPGPKV